MGEVVAELIAREVRSIEGLMETDESTLAAIEGVGPIVAHSVHSWLAQDHSQELVQDLVAVGVAYPEPEERASAGALMDGLTAVVTGTLEGLNRKDAEALLKKNGAKVASSVSKKTSFLLAGEKAGSKLTKAEGFGVRVLSLAEVQAWIEGGPSPMGED